MKHIAAYALLILGGNNAPTAADIEKVLKEAGVKGDADKAAAVVAACAGKEFTPLLPKALRP
jgi:large subunit ribosomal protein LP2